MRELTTSLRTVWIRDEEGNEEMKNCSASIFGASGTVVAKIN